MSTTQIFHSFGNENETCALGAALLGFGEFPSDCGPLLKIISGDNSPVVDCCRCAYLGTVGSVVMHLNDNHKMPRNEIADWLEELGL